MTLPHSSVKSPDDIQSPLILRAMAPIAQNERLFSPAIDQTIEDWTENEKSSWYWYGNQPDNSIEEEDFARKLGQYYLLKTAQNLSSPNPEKRGKDRETWAKRFTEASIELYGAPDIAYARNIIDAEMTVFKSFSGKYIDRIQHNFSLLARAVKLEISNVKTAESVESLPLNQEQIIELRSALYELNGDWFEHILSNQKNIFHPEDVVQLINDLFSIRSTKDDRYARWSGRISKNEDVFKVTAQEQIVEVGENRLPMTHNELIGLIGHELGNHVTRSINGSEDSRLGLGLPGYLDVEESLGILFELILTGHMPEKAGDRYLDVALALGTIPGYRLSRGELIEFGMNRELARQELAGERIDETKIEIARKRITTHVNRIYRGGDGLNGENPAVFTKDIVYYPAKIETYISKNLLKGYTSSQIIQFLLQGKFDPTIPSHLKYHAVRPIETFS